MNRKNIEALEKNLAEFRRDSDIKHHAMNLMANNAIKWMYSEDTNEGVREMGIGVARDVLVATINPVADLLGATRRSDLIVVFMRTTWSENGGIYVTTEEAQEFLDDKVAVAAASSTEDLSDVLGFRARARAVVKAIKAAKQR